MQERHFGLGTRADVNKAAQLATAAFDPYRHLPQERRAEFLEAIADEILALGDAIVERAHAESGLPIARLTGERGRTIGQLRLFAQVVRDGHFLRAVIDPAQADRQPMPRSDLRQARIPLGPVAVFGASNFPLVFSVACGDTASALAAGTPVVVKAHSAHLGTSELVGRAVQKAAQRMGMPEGVFSLLIGAGRDIDKALVAHPAIKAVGFTGSRQGGLALVNIDNNRHEPIPVYAEAIATGFIGSLVLGAGQFCTKPGLLLAIDGPDIDRFIAAAGKALIVKAPQVMLTPGIFSAYCHSRDQAQAAAGVELIANGMVSGDLSNAAQAALYVTSAQQLLSNETLQAEMFGPASIIVKARNLEELLQVAEQLEGQLTATLQIDAADYAAAQALLPILERKSGRILANGFPTGVEVSHAMVHGGPFPATSQAGHTSVGVTAIDRFLRPVCYQDLPDVLRPPPLQQENSLSIWRLIDGVPTQPK